MRYFFDHLFLKIVIGTILFVSSDHQSQGISPKTQNILKINSLSGERIFFVKKHNVEGLLLGDIYSMDPQGNDTQRLTNFSAGFAWAELPQISWDGTKLGFISNFESWKSTNYTDAFIADLERGNFTRITGFEKTTPFNNTGTINVNVNIPEGFVISPSAVRISFRGCTEFVSGNSAVLTVPADEQIWVKAESSKAKGDFKWLSVTEGGNTSITLDLSNGTLSAESCSPSFNGDYLAVSENSESVSNSEGQTFSWYKVIIWDTKQRKELGELGGFKLGGDITPSFSPNDSFIAFCTGQQTLQGVGIIPASNYSTDPTIIAEGNFIGYQAYCSNPAWSPNGEEIAYAYVIISTSLWGIHIQSNIFKVNVSNGQTEQLTFYSDKEVASRPTFSPDGSRIAFTHSISKGSYFTLNDYITGNYTSNIFVIPSAGGTASALTTDGNSHDPSWGIVPSAVGITENIKTPKSIQLYQNYPNPFNNNTRIKFHIPEHNDRNNLLVRLEVFNAIGEKITSLIEEELAGGHHEKVFDASELSSGIYFYKLTVDDSFNIRKMILLK